MVHIPSRMVQSRPRCGGALHEKAPGGSGKQKLCERAVAHTVKEFRRIDVLVNNAAFQIRSSQLEDVSNRCSTL
jgi:NAD(P)-dependent dehydrogenase (short-subunit alcohol dehydrogenase family)